MKIINFSETDSVINRYLAEIRDADYQKNRLLFRNNITRIGEMMAYEMSKTLTYEEREVTTPLGTARIRLPQDSIVLSTIFRAGLPLHAGFPECVRPCRQRFCKRIPQVYRRSPYGGGHRGGISGHTES